MPDVAGLVHATNSARQLEFVWTPDALPVKKNPVAAAARSALALRLDLRVDS